jgi:hypothetical protein
VYFCVDQGTRGILRHCLIFFEYPHAEMFFSTYRMDFELFQHVNKALQDTKLDVKLDEKYRSHTYWGQREFTPHAKMNGQRAMRRKTK